MVTISSTNSVGYYEYGLEISFDEVEYFDLVISDYQVKITVVDSINVINTTMGDLDPITTTRYEILDLISFISRKISDGLCRHNFLLWPVGPSNHLTTVSKLILSSMEKCELTRLIAHASSSLYSSAFNIDLPTRWELNQKALDVINFYFDISDSGDIVSKNRYKVMK